MKKIIVIVGPTSSGKSNLGVEIAERFNGEIVSADSRQIYRGLDIGSGKITKKEMCGIPHHLLDVANPQKRFSVADYKKKAEKSINEILDKNKLPIIVGGTGFYIQSIVDGIVLPKVPANKSLQKKLGKASLLNLQKILKKLDPRRYKNIDIQNPRRLIRAIEIARVLGKVPKQKNKPLYNTLQIGIKTDTQKLNKLIHKRLLSRIKSGMVAEAKKLHQRGLSWKRMEELGLEYRYLCRYLRKYLSKQEMLIQLEKEIQHYVKRQNTWFKKDARIKWFNLKEKKKIDREVGIFLK